LDASSFDVFENIEEGVFGDVEGANRVHGYPIVYYLAAKTMLGLKPTIKLPVLPELVKTQ